MSEAIILTNYITKETQIVNQVVNRYINVTYKLQTELITRSTNWEVPNHYGNIYVRIFGGGGSGGEVSSRYAGGGGGWMNNGEFNISEGRVVQIVIGAGGIFPYNRYGTTGGSTTFGTYVSANGGNGGGYGGGWAIEGGSGGSGGGSEGRSGGGGYGGDGGNNGGGGGGYGYYGEGGVGSYSVYGGGGGGYSSGGYGGGGGMRVSDSMYRLGEGGTWSSESSANGTSGVCVIYYYKWLSNGEQLGI